MKGMHWFVIIIELILAVYLINLPFSFVPIPEVISNFNTWITFVAGVFLIYGAYSHYLSHRHII